MNASYDTNVAGSSEYMRYVINGASGRFSLPFEKAHDYLKYGKNRITLYVDGGPHYEFGTNSKSKFATTEFVLRDFFLAQPLATVSVQLDETPGAGWFESVGSDQGIASGFGTMIFQ